jgi:hypothetical protein
VPNLNVYRRSVDLTPTRIQAHPQTRDALAESWLRRTLWHLRSEKSRWIWFSTKTFIWPYLIILLLSIGLAAYLYPKDSYLASPRTLQMKIRGFKASDTPDLTFAFSGDYLEFSVYVPRYEALYSRAKDEDGGLLIIDLPFAVPKQSFGTIPGESYWSLYPPAAKEGGRDSSLVLSWPWNSPQISRQLGGINFQPIDLGPKVNLFTRSDTQAALSLPQIDERSEVKEAVVSVSHWVDDATKYQWTGAIYAPISNYGGVGVADVKIQAGEPPIILQGTNNSAARWRDYRTLISGVLLGGVAPSALVPMIQEILSFNRKYPKFWSMPFGFWELTRRSSQTYPRKRRNSAVSVRRIAGRRPPQNL